MSPLDWAERCDWWFDRGRDDEVGELPVGAVSASVLALEAKPRARDRALTLQVQVILVR